MGNETFYWDGLKRQAEKRTDISRRYHWFPRERKPSKIFVEEKFGEIKHYKTCPCKQEISSGTDTFFFIDAFFPWSSTQAFLVSSRKALTTLKTAV